MQFFLKFLDASMLENRVVCLRSNIKPMKMLVRYPFLYPGNRRNYLVFLEEYQTLVPGKSKDALTV